MQQEWRPSILVGTMIMVFQENCLFNVILIENDCALGTVSPNWTINLQLLLLSNWQRFVSGTYIQSMREKVPEMTNKPYQQLSKSAITQPVDKNNNLLTQILKINAYVISSDNHISA